ncbi:30S ribosomal protein S2 [archaeon]|nr:30S ribosomal protein S2 [archaeon]NCP79554.1 30S ribosomal protein S2 [archaeon]NCP97498.1 30S ribosomal protein S2 [archaeon]NCQ07321.1 30S ribosomal protein S2 [archaeon]NCQ51117.1 30S ribosomal protein S2 [archaeon]
MNKSTENKAIENNPSEKRTPNNRFQKTLVNIDLYLKNGIHIGTKYKNGAMRRFIFKSRSDKLNVMDVQIIDQRIKTSIEFLSKFNPEDVVFVSRKKYALFGLTLLEKTFGYKIKVGRFIPGTFTNPDSEHFMEPKLVFVVDPNIDRQAILEATKIRVPIVALATTSSNVRNIDLLVPFNNKGRKSIALYFWLLNRELQLKNGFIKSEKEYNYKVDDFVITNDDKKDDETRDRKPRPRFVKKPFRK